MKSYDIKDLEEISAQNSDFKIKYENHEILIAGVTGFVGSWLLASLDYMNRERNIFQITGVARNIFREYREKFPSVKFVETDVSHNLKNVLDSPQLIFNAATPSIPSHGGIDARQVLDAAAKGTQNLIDICSSNEKATFINLSSGIVTKRKEDLDLVLTDIKDAYLEGKRRSEAAVIKATQSGYVFGKNLRLYSFAGPGISLQDHFAVGNFVRDAVNGQPITINGNPATKRSYMYPVDLVASILRSSLDRQQGHFEIGSTVPLRIIELAHLINKVTGNSGINQKSYFGPPDEYYPHEVQDVCKSAISLEESIIRWSKWIKCN